jgi:hypothetical protein
VSPGQLGRVAVIGGSAEYAFLSYAPPSLELRTSVFSKKARTQADVGWMVGTK